MLVKALPQPSKRYGETVCCAGVTADRQWKRLYPVRYRHLAGESAFRRWDWVSFEYGRPKSDPRAESCHVHEESIVVEKPMPEADRSKLLCAMFKASGVAAAESGCSLALIEPRNTKFSWRKKSDAELEEDRVMFREAARQHSLLDKPLAEMDPTPYEFFFQFEDGAGRHQYRNGDWEAHATIWRRRKETSEAEALRFLSEKFNDEYPKRGMAFAIGNMAKRPKTWQLLGVLRLDTAQGVLL